MTNENRNAGDNVRGGLRRWRHPVRKQTYEEMGDGTCRVVCDDGREGLFDNNGRYLSGTLTQASREMIVWVTGPRMPPGCNFRWSEVPIDINRASGWPEDLEEVLRSHGVTLGQDIRIK